MVVMAMNWKKKLFTWPQVLLFIAFFISAMQYKRNNFFLVLICVPLLVAGWQAIVLLVKDNNCNSEGAKRPKNPLMLFLLKLRDYSLHCVPLRMTTIYAACLVYAIWFLPHLRVNQNIWHDKELLTKYSFPVKATEFLQQKTKNEINPRFFNAYSWGGYMVWNLPNALLHLDGRSAATWVADDGESWLQKHIEVITKENKLIELEKNQVKYIILEKKLLAYPRPNWLNKIIFDKKDLNRLFSLDSMQIEKDLAQSKNWQLIYTDEISNVWENTK
jgi:hypothetical protein